MLLELVVFYRQFKFTALKAVLNLQSDIKYKFTANPVGDEDIRVEAAVVAVAEEHMHLDKFHNSAVVLVEILDSCTELKYLKKKSKILFLNFVSLS